MHAQTSRGMRIGTQGMKRTPRMRLRNVSPKCRPPDSDPSTVHSDQRTARRQAQRPIEPPRRPGSASVDTISPALPPSWLRHTEAAHALRPSCSQQLSRFAASWPKVVAMEPEHLGRSSRPFRVLPRSTGLRDGVNERPGGRCGRAIANSGKASVARAKDPSPLGWERFGDGQHDATQWSEVRTMEVADRRPVGNGLTAT